MTASNGLATHTATDDFANIVIFVQFDGGDGTFMAGRDDVDLARKLYLDTTFPKSLVSYVNAISYGQLRVNTIMPQYDAMAGTITPVTLPKSRDHYVQEQSEYELINDVLTDSELTAVVEASGAQIVDYTGDGCVDNVTFVFDGDADDRGSILFPHKEDFNGDQSIYGKAVSTVNVLTGDRVFEDGAYDRYGVICHEFLHSLGYPDLYKQAGGTPVGMYDLMAQSSNFLQYPLAYLRSQISGWLDIETIAPTTATRESFALSLSPATSSSGDRAFVLKSPLSDSELFVVEYRKQGRQYSDELEVKIPGDGLIVYRVNTKVERLSNYTGDLDGVYVFRPGETSVIGGSLSNLLEAQCSLDTGRTSIGSLDFDATIADGALVFSDGTNSGIYLHDIGSAGDTIDFTVDFADTSNVGVWEKVAGTNVSATPSSEIALDVVPADQSGMQNVVYAAHEGENGLVISCSASGAWTALGDAIVDYGDGARLEVYDGVPYVLFCRASDYTPVLYRYSDAGGWVLVKQLSTTMSSFLDMTDGPQGLMIAYSEEEEGGSSNTLKVIQVDANGVVEEVFVDDDTPWTSAYHLSATSENVYLSYRNVNTNAALIKRIGFANGEFSVTSLAAPSAAFSDSLICATDSIVFLVTDSDVGVRVYELTSDGWVQMGSTLTSMTSTSMNADLVNGMPVVQVLDQSSSPKRTLVYKYADGAWIQEGLPVEMSAVNDAKMCAVGNQVYVAYFSGSNYGDTYPVVKFKEVVVQPHADSTIQPEMTGIVVTLPTKTTYVIGEAFDPAGMAVVAGYTDNTTAVLDGSAYEVLGFDSSSVGEKTLTVRAGGYSETFMVTVNLPDPGPVDLPDPGPVDPADPGPVDPPDPGPVDPIDSETPTLAPTLSFRAHVQNRGDIGPVSNGEIIGTTGSSLRMEAIYLTLGGTLGATSGIVCQAHVQDIGWMAPVGSNERCGTAGESKRIEALSIRLSSDLEAAGYRIYYRVHAQDVGWMGWTSDGGRAGTAGNSLRLEAIQICLVAPDESAPGASHGGIKSATTHPYIDSSSDKPVGDVSYKAIVHIQNRGDVRFTSNGSKFLGTTGSSLRLEGLTITELAAPKGVDLGMEYRTHVQNIGWQGFKRMGEMSGTSAKSLRLEALTLRLIGSDKGDYDVYYRTHVQNIGWTGWAMNGQNCGSAGYSYRMEAMQIVVVPKNGTAPGLNSGYFYQR